MMGWRWRRAAAAWQMAGLLLFLHAASISASELSITGEGTPALVPLDELMTSFIAEQGLPGGAFAVAKEGRLLYARGVGVADLETGDVVQPDSRFRIASISKPITAAMVFRLVESDRLDLDEPAFPRIASRLGLIDEECGDSRIATITIRHLLQHRGGYDRGISFDPMFRSVSIARELETDAPASAEDVVRWMWKRPLDFAPGERSAYSNFGYCVLGRVIEAVTGRSYEEAVLHEVLQPLGITTMRIGATREAGRAEGEVRYHVAKERIVDSVWPDDGKVPVQYGGWHQEAMDAHGGWIASAIDLVKFASALDDSTTLLSASSDEPLLSVASRTTMFARPDGPAGYGVDGTPLAAFYACGWMVRPVGDRGANQWHTGALEGTSTLLVRRHDGFRWAVLFHSMGDGERLPAAAIDPLVHRAIDRVRDWPEGTELNAARSVR